MNDAELTLVMKAKNLASKEVDRLNGSLGKVKGAAGSAVGGLVGLGKAAVGLAAGGLLAVVAGLGFATHAAADEQKGIVKLNAALAANVKGFSGNTDAIEKVIAKREELGFSDDDLRESLTKLVTRTHDVDKAMQLQAVAMDIARLKGIGVAEASDLVTKGMGGATKVLKDLGIVLPATATEQDRLNAIMKVSAGQADAYGKSAAGAQDAFKIATDDLIEDIGSGFLPIMQAAFTWLRTNAIPAVRAIIAKVGEWFAQNKDLTDQIGKVVSFVLPKLVDAIGFVLDKVGKLVGGIGDLVKWLWGDGKSPLAVGIGGVVGLFGHVVDAIGFVIDKIATLIGWIRDAIGWLQKLADIKLPDYAPGSHFQPGTKGGGHAAGGWVGLNGPEIGMLGEQGPEYIIPNHQLGSGAPAASGSGFTIMGVSERELVDMVERGLYFRLQRAAPARGRS